ncbi:hypothetical protein GCM10010193_21870 [Kitasatospora atroaurantiaca]|uniref:Uncharacterized protein DUF2233 n=1 Tax=Kitasatospora atroaurantiaca TaxID=285545 RepID=A0A561EUX6_9ACTN|nr:phosphodiester glycosidase family protein [Kitasatospora atroaurantiaca]TWE19423.1 uncharacterized protein DUF2233 [Kitasatospora atroaurantiaca]
MPALRPRLTGRAGRRVGAALAGAVLLLPAAVPDLTGQARTEHYGLPAGARLTVADVPRQSLRYQLTEAALGPARLTSLGGRLSERESLSALADGAGPAALAAVNGDFFDIHGTGVPLGPVIRDGQVLKASAEPVRAVGTDRDGLLRRGLVRLAGAVSVGGTPYPLGCLNCRSLRPGLTVFTPDWGGAPRPVRARGPVRQLTVSGGRAVDVREGADGRPVPGDGFVLVAVGRAARALSAVPPGAPVAFRAGQDGDGGTPWDLAIGYRGTLLRKGRVPAFPRTHRYEIREPRTALAWDASGRRLWLLTVDGRSAGSAGLTIAETARLLQRLGARNAVMLDGGGSTEMLARTSPGTMAIVNAPSGGSERPVPNGLALVSPQSRFALRRRPSRASGRPSRASGRSDPAATPGAPALLRRSSLLRLATGAPSRPLR